MVIDKIDIPGCESAPIRFPGSILPHGALLVVHAESGLIEAASASCVDLFGRPVETEFVLATLLKWLDAQHL